MASTEVPKANTYRIYLDATSAASMGAICNATELSQVELLQKVVAAGLRAIREQGDTYTLPLRFQVMKSEHAKTA